MMSPRRALLTATVLMLAFLPSCAFVVPTAPLLATISISANPLAIGLNGERSTITVIGSPAEGNPAPDGTIVFLTTTLGSIPDQVALTNGRATTQLISGAQAGVATITASSGADAVASLDVMVGTVLAGLSVTATPATLPNIGGQAAIKAVAFDADGEPLANVPVTFSTTAGTLASAGTIVRTDANGEAADQLATTAAATVTAVSGSFSAATIVALGPANAAPVAGFSVSPANPMEGHDVFFNAAASMDSDGTIVSYEWDFGDGTTGSGRQTSHVYAGAGTFVVVLTVTDNSGATAVMSAAVTVS